MYIIKKGIIISLAILLSVNSFSGLSVLGDETKNCLATAIEAQGALLSFFNLTSIPVEIVNKLFNEESTPSSAPSSQKQKQRNSVPCAQPVISQFKPLQFEKKSGNINNPFDCAFPPTSVTTELRHCTAG